MLPKASIKISTASGELRVVAENVDIHDDAEINLSGKGLRDLADVTLGKILMMMMLIKVVAENFDIHDDNLADANVGKIVVDVMVTMTTMLEFICHKGPNDQADVILGNIVSMG